MGSPHKLQAVATSASSGYQPVNAENRPGDKRPSTMASPPAASKMVGGSGSGIESCLVQRTSDVKESNPWGFQKTVSS